VVYFTRRHEGEEIFCAFNMSDTPSEFAVPHGGWQIIGEELGGARISADGHLHLGPWQPFLAVVTPNE